MTKYKIKVSEKNAAYEADLKTNSDVQLICTVIGTFRNRNAIEVAEFILEDNDGDLAELSRRSMDYLMSKYGLTKKKATALYVSLELSRRFDISRKQKQPPISSSEKAYRIMSKELSNLPHEEFWIALFNKSNKLIKKVKISSGGIGSTDVDPKLIFASILENKASSVILYHNHPSGRLKPSKQDVELTDRIKLGAEYMDINLLDHIIIGGDGYYSFAEDNNL